MFDMFGAEPIQSKNPKWVTKDKVITSARSASQCLAMLMFHRVYKPAAQWRHHPTSSYQQQFVWATQQNAPRTFQHGSLHWESLSPHWCTIFTINKKKLRGKVKRKEARGNARQRAQRNRSQTQVQHTRCSQSSASIQPTWIQCSFYAHVTISLLSDKRWYLPSRQ